MLLLRREPFGEPRVDAGKPCIKPGEIPSGSLPTKGGMGSGVWGPNFAKGKPLCDGYVILALGGPRCPTDQSGGAGLRVGEARPRRAGNFPKGTPRRPRGYIAESLSPQQIEGQSSRRVCSPVPFLGMNPLA